MSHPWAFEAPEGLRGWARTGCGTSSSRWLAVSELDRPFEEKLELITLVDDYVFGHFVRQNEHFTEERDPDPGVMRRALDFMTEQVKTGDYTETARVLEGVDIGEAWGPDSDAAKLFMGNRFERGLDILLDGIDLEIKRRKKAKKK